MRTRDVRRILARRDLAALEDLASRRSRVLHVLVALTFDPQPLIGWRAVEAMGLAARRIVADHPAAVREHMRRLTWLLNDESGGVCWRAPEALAEIVHCCADHVADYVPLVVHLLDNMAEEDLERFRPGVLWAIGRLGFLARAHVEAVLPRIEAALGDPVPQVRGNAAWCLGQVDRLDALRARPELLEDEGRLACFRDGELESTDVRTLVREALARRA